MKAKDVKSLAFFILLALLMENPGGFRHTYNLRSSASQSSENL